MKSALHSLLLAAALIAGSAQAAGPIDVQSYDMYDWSRLNSWSWYSDQSYSGSVSAGWLSGGEGELTDGFVAGYVNGGYANWSPYVLWDAYSPVITFDLGARYTVHGVTASFLSYPDAAVYIPPTASLRFSDDGVNFSVADTRVFSTAERALGNDVPVSYELLDLPRTGRYVEITFQTPGRWIALSEVTFQGAVAAVPEPEPYALMLAGLGLVGFATRRRARPVRRH